MLSVPATVAISLVNVAARAGLNVIDRRAFGHHRAPIAEKNLTNNSYSVVFFVLLAVGFGQWPDIQRVISSLLDWRVASLATLTQIIAYAFGMAFRTMRIPRVITASKLPDILIPVGLWLCFGTWSTLDFVFSVVTVCVCLPVMLESVKRDGNLHPAFYFIAGSLLLQALTVPFFVRPMANSVDFISYTLGLMIWRCVLSLFVWAIIRERSHRIPACRRNKWKVYCENFLRGCIGMITQVSFYYVLSEGYRPVAWPILNSTALLSTVASAWILGEHPTRRENVAVGCIALCAAIRAFC